jgi:hypothetical protein
MDLVDAQTKLVILKKRASLLQARKEVFRQEIQLIDQELAEVAEETEGEQNRCKYAKGRVKELQPRLLGCMR